MKKLTSLFSRIIASVMAAVLACGLLGAGTPQAFAADPYPSHPIKLIVPFGAGGPTDLQYRKLAEQASKHLGQPIIIENKPGAGTTLGPSIMAKVDKPDGYTVSAALAPLLRYPHMQKVDWDPLRDFTWIIGLGGYTFVYAVKADSPFKTMQDVIGYAKANPEKVTVGTAGAGTTQHLLVEALGAIAGAKFTHIGFRSGAENMQSLLGGHTVAGVDAIGSFLPQVEAGKLRVLMSFDETRPTWMADVPTAKSLGYDLAYPAPYGLVGPRGMPPNIVKTLHDAFKTAMDSPENKKTLDTLRQTYWYRSSTDYEQWAKQFYVSERSLVERANLLVKP
jgi:tripartite-type tricarboxylate transporter receptor subunit TctC